MKQPSLATIFRVKGPTTALCVTMLTATPLPAGEPVAQLFPDKKTRGVTLSEWENRRQMTGNWFGARNTLADNGLTFKGKYEGIFFGVVDSQGGSRGFYDQELAFSTKLDFAKLLEVDALEGLKGFAGVRWRDPRGNSQSNRFVEASSLFKPSNNQSGTQWRLTTFGVEYATPELFGINELLTVRGGWLRPQKEFIDQPLSKLFVNNAVHSAKGVGGNIPFSSSFSTWGGTLEVKPAKWHYAKAGLFMAFPKATSSSNHGLAFEGFAQDPSRNGLMVMAETGVTPKLGDSELPGKYAFGGYYFGVEKESFNGTPNDGQYGFYAQAGQMLFREPSPEETAPMGKRHSNGKPAADATSFKTPIQSAPPRLSRQGLSVFNLVSFAPKHNNLYPFYFQTGFVYEGLIPTRDKDRTMFSLAYGSYSHANINNLQSEGVADQPNYTVFLEFDYRIQVNKWAYFQPFIQYIIKPNGTGAVQNATILGFAYSVAF